MDSTDEDKLAKYSKLADTLREVHKATGGSAARFVQSDEILYAIKGDDGREYLVGAPSLYLAAAEVIEDLLARAREASEDF